MGRAFAQRLAEAGAAVAIAEVNAETGQQAAQELVAAGHQALFYLVDVRESPSIQAMTDDLVTRFGRVDILVNNAGVAAGGPSEDVSEDEWNRVLGIMLTGLFHCSQIVGRVMIKQGGGRIVNIASMTGIGAWNQRACYTTAKAGVIALTQVLGVEWAKYNIRVNAIAPGQVETPLNEYVFSRGLADRQTFTNRAPMRRFADPTEIAEAVLFLASEESSYMTADVLVIDGGWMAWGQLSLQDQLPT
jgi:NAD(P)-dependent dehydrogenase (short-subunit alcohol dehydrogenase family)